jgi:hypothetical protein
MTTFGMEFVRFLLEMVNDGVRILAKTYKIGERFSAEETRNLESLAGL